MCATYSVCEQFRGKHLDKCSDECAESGGSIVLYKTENSKAGDIQAHLKKNTVTLEPREAILLHRPFCLSLLRSDIDRTCSIQFGAIDRESQSSAQ